MKMMTRRGAMLLSLLILCLCGCVQAQAPAPGGMTHIKDVIYGKKQGVALTMDVFKPAKPSGIGIIWMVSGGWVSNHNSINPALGQMMTERGHTLFQVVHGSQPKFTLPEIVQDIHRAVRFIRAHASEYGVDPNRLGISGGSAGGHLSLMMGAYGGPGKPDAKDPIDRESSAVQAVACFFPPTDFLNYGETGKSAMRIATLKSYWHVFGVTEKTTDEDGDKIGHTLSPIYGVTEKMPPTFIIHGDADTLVPIQQAQRIIAKIEECKVPCKLDTRSGKGHGWPGMEKDAALLAEWFEKYLAKK
jgi:acetyl esterase/lipase